MSLFLENSRFSEKTINVEAEVYGEEFSLIEAGYTAVIECAENWNTLMQAVGLAELHELWESGQVVTESGNITSFLQGIKNWLAKVFKKIKGLFDKFIAKIMSLVSSDKAFVEKYEKQILAGAGKIPSSLEMKGYKFPNLKGINNKFKAANTNIGDVETAASNASIDGNKAMGKNAEKVANAYRAELCGGKRSSVEAGEFHKEFTTYIKGEKETLNKEYLSQARTFIEDIKTAKETKSEAEENFKTLKDGVNSALSDLSDLEKKFHDIQGKDTSASEGRVRLVADGIKAKWDINVLAQSIFLSALKDRNRQYKAICVKLVGLSSREEKVDESYQMETPVGRVRLV